jgi:hypothetical protein
MAPQLQTALYAVPRGFHKGNGQTSHVGGTSNGAAARSATVTIHGFTVDFGALASMTKSEVALVNADARRAGWPARLTQAVIGGNPGLVSTARHLSPGERELITRGEKTLSDYHGSKKKKLDREIKNFLKRPGVADAVLRVIDHLTTPTPLIAAE